MLIEDMIYILHDRSLAEHVDFSLSLEKELQLVDLEQDPPTVDFLSLMCLCSC